MNVENIVTGETSTRQLRGKLFLIDGMYCQAVRRRLFNVVDQDSPASAEDVNAAKKAIMLDLCNACGND